MSQTSSESYVGQVKWFNNRLGYGFITIISECDRKNVDVFVHQQHITPKTSEYRSLQQGEYVSFNLGKADSEGESAKHDSQAINVTGVFGGSLMCDQTSTQQPPTTTRSDSGYKSKPHTTSAPPRRPRGPRQTSEQK
jgi:cold shock CspA family protein